MIDLEKVKNIPDVKLGIIAVSREYMTSSVTPIRTGSIILPLSTVIQRY